MSLVDLAIKQRTNESNRPSLEFIAQSSDNRFGLLSPVIPNLNYGVSSG